MRALMLLTTGTMVFLLLFGGPLLGAEAEEGEDIFADTLEDWIGTWVPRNEEGLDEDCGDFTIKVEWTDPEKKDKVKITLNQTRKDPRSEKLPGPVVLTMVKPWKNPNKEGDILGKGELKVADSPADPVVVVYDTIAKQVTTWRTKEYSNKRKTIPYEFSVTGLGSPGESKDWGAVHLLSHTSGDFIILAITKKKR